MKYNIIDSHVHLKHGDAKKTEFSAEAIVETMDAVGIDRSVVFAMSTTTRRSIEMAKEAVSKFKNRLIPYVYALPSYERPTIKEIDQALSEFGFKGIKLHAGECTLSEHVTDPVIELAGELGVPCLIDCLGNREVVALIAERFPRTNIIIAHLGRYLCRDEKLIDSFIELAAEHRNLFLDTSGVVLSGKILEAVQKVGQDRVIFGTDGPAMAPDTVSYARRELNKIIELNLEKRILRAILGENILRLIGEL